MVTTDHISPAGSFKSTTPAGKYLTERQIPPRDFNSYGSRRGNHEVMMRGTFANIRIKNEMLDGVEGGYSLGPDGEQTSIFDAAMAYQAAGVPLVVIGGVEYGAGSSRDWAAKGTALLGVKAVIAESFERIHRSNLVGMGVIPFEFTAGDNRRTLGLKGDEVISISGLAGDLKPLSMRALHHLLRRRPRADDRAQVPDRYRGGDRVRRERRRAALRAAQPRQGGLRLAGGALLREFPDLPPIWALGAAALAWGLARVAPLAPLPAWPAAPLGLAGFGIVIWAALWFRAQAHADRAARGAAGADRRGAVPGEPQPDLQRDGAGAARLGLLPRGGLGAGAGAGVSCRHRPTLREGEEAALRAGFGPEAERYLAATRRW